MKVRHYKHPDRVYTILGRGIISALTSAPISDMDVVTIYSDAAGRLFVCRKGDPVREGFKIISSEGKAQTKTPLKIADSVTVYKSDDDGSHWARPTDEFDDGRFAEDHTERVFLWQARYALRDMHAKFPNCGYNKLADACERAADREGTVNGSRPFR